MARSLLADGKALAVNDGEDYALTVMGASFAGDTGGRRGKRRLRHAVSVTCSNRRSFAADRIESQMARLLTARFRLPQDWQRKYLLALAAAAETGPTAGKPDRQRLERARENLRSLFVWGELAEADYRCQREEIDRQILAIATVAAPVALTGIRRAAELPQDMGSLWLHPGVNPERRKEFTDEVFEEIQFDEKGIRAVRPSDEYRPLLAVAEADWGGEMVGATGFEPATS